MIDDFRNRIDTQREVLELINSYKWQESLFGLSEKAIDRWSINNNVSKDVVFLLRSISDKLFFLGVRSQEQITDEYLTLSSEISREISVLNNLMIIKYS